MSNGQRRGGSSRSSTQRSVTRCIAEHRQPREREAAAVSRPAGSSDCSRLGPGVRKLIRQMTQDDRLPPSNTTCLAALRETAARTALTSAAAGRTNLSGRIVGSDHSAYPLCESRTHIMNTAEIARDDLGRVVRAPELTGLTAITDGMTPAGAALPAHAAGRPLMGRWLLKVTDEVRGRE
jgi:hypothetical protein